MTEEEKTQTTDKLAEGQTSLFTNKVYASKI